MIISRSESEVASAQKLVIPVRSHVLVVVVAALIVIVSLFVGGILSQTINDDNHRVLVTQSREIATAVQSTVDSIKAQLESADRVALIGSTSAFNSIMLSEVGPGAPFHNLSLWTTKHGQLTLSTLLGAGLTLGAISTKRNIVQFVVATTKQSREAKVLSQI